MYSQDIFPSYFTDTDCRKNSDLGANRFRDVFAILYDISRLWKIEILGSSVGRAGGC